MMGLLLWLMGMFFPSLFFNRGSMVGLWGSVKWTVRDVCFRWIAEG